MTSLHTPFKPISNGPKATHPARPPPPVRMFLSKTSTPIVMSCIRCHRTLPTHSTVNCCGSCRRKQDERIKLPQQGRAAWQTHEPSMYIPTVVNTTASTGNVEASPDAYIDVKMADEPGGCGSSPSRSSTGAVKRKANAMMNSEGPEVEDHLHGNTALDTTLRREFQTGRDLVGALSEALEASRASRATAAPHCPSYVKFHGSYTIVMDPDVRGGRRVKQVVDELKQSAKLRCGIVKRESEQSCGGHARTFWCACDPPSQPSTQHPPSGPGSQTSTLILATPAASQVGTPPKRTQSTFMGWLAKSQSKEKIEDEVMPLPPPGCGGTITVYAVTDFSHPLGRMGIEGQKITVQIEHPGRDFKHALL